MWQSLWTNIQAFGWTGLTQVLVLWVGFYYILLFFRGTRGAQALVGLALILAILIGLTQIANLDVLSWILRNITVYLAIAILIIFQPEIRRALAEVGKHPSLGMNAQVHSAIEEVVEGVFQLAEKRTGALIAMERDIATRFIQETGTPLDAKITPDLLASVFFPRSPLHDGGMIISGDRILAAGCVFPLSEETELNKALGTRHRAALGMSEETDSAVIVVSEETGQVSTCYRGTLTQGADAAHLRQFLSTLLIHEKKTGSAWRRMRRHLDFTPRGIARSEKLKEREAARE